jgi:DNA repair exonuclease SbcCD ATPase subunit
MKRCRVCKEKFTPTYSSLQATCTKPTCLIEWGRIAERKKAKREIRQMRENLKSVSAYRRDLQKVFNEFIRLRDSKEPCISCGRPLPAKYDAGHFYSVGSYPNLRFNEDNVHGQCVECNQHKHGNLLEYSPRLTERIGFERASKLMVIRNEPLRLSLNEIKDLTTYYKKRVNEWKKANG